MENDNQLPMPFLYTDFIRYWSDFIKASGHNVALNQIHDRYISEIDRLKEENGKLKDQNKKAFELILKQEETVKNFVLDNGGLKCELSELREALKQITQFDFNPSEPYGSIQDIKDIAIEALYKNKM